MISCILSLPGSLYLIPVEVRYQNENIMKCKKFELCFHKYVITI